MKKRTLKNGQDVVELASPITLKVYTKCPEKWILIDLENNKIYKGTTNQDIGKNWEYLSSSFNEIVIKNEKK